MRNRGFPATQPGQHLSVRAHKNSFSTKVASWTALWQCWRQHCVKSCKRNSTSDQCGLKQQQPAPSHGPTPESWEQLDEVDQSEWFLARIPMLKSCPYFLRGGLQCWAVALCERHRARFVHDNAAEERAWKLFGLGPGDAAASGPTSRRFCPGTLDSSSPQCAPQCCRGVWDERR